MYDWTWLRLLNAFFHMLFQNTQKPNRGRLVPSGKYHTALYGTRMKYRMVPSILVIMASINTSWELCIKINHILWHFECWIASETKIYWLFQAIGQTYDLGIQVSVCFLVSQEVCQHVLLLNLHSKKANLKPLFNVSLNVVGWRCEYSGFCQPGCCWSVTKCRTSGTPNPSSKENILVCFFTWRALRQR